MTEAHDPDEALDVYGAREAVLALGRRVQAVRSGRAAEADAVLAPPLSRRDHLDGAQWAPASLVVFGAYGTPASRSLGKLLEQLREAHAGSLCVGWRHFPDPEAHLWSVAFALAAEAAATEARFWAMTRALLRIRHEDAIDLQAAARRAGVDFDRLLHLMRAGTGADRVVADVQSALASGVTSASTLFVKGERYRGDLDPAAVWAACTTVART